MKIEILGREASGTCDVTQKKDTLVYVIRVGGPDGVEKRVCKSRLIEVIDWNCDLPESSPATAKQPQPSREPCGAKGN
ncbi:hypothetical protein Mal52_13720 [Symmachiella dynata]|uniref:Uncharacterized protein n=1 Tax=Symmachiella dynata TaxID=2527995 RepID=A0A517ZKG3_9PLAN|nr:hypothetical protein [Symmachiella dynata]QDU42903.1 hypothetical protein Mal52_13720 [Symmachiella dynata]